MLERNEKNKKREDKRRLEKQRITGERKKDEEEKDAEREMRNTKCERKKKSVLGLCSVGRLAMGEYGVYGWSCD